jgi:hypothetical protein
MDLSWGADAMGSGWKTGAFKKEVLHSFSFFQLGQLERLKASELISIVPVFYASDGGWD